MKKKWKIITKSSNFFFFLQDQNDLEKQFGYGISELSSLHISHVSSCSENEDDGEQKLNEANKCLEYIMFPGNDDNISLSKYCFKLSLIFLMTPFVSFSIFIVVSDLPFMLACVAGWMVRQDLTSLKILYSTVSVLAWIPNLAFCRMYWITFLPWPTTALQLARLNSLHDQN